MIMGNQLGVLLLSYIIEARRGSALPKTRGDKDHSIN